jgi:hypothetical protein
MKVLTHDRQRTETSQRKLVQRNCQLPVRPPYQHAVVGNVGVGLLVGLQHPHNRQPSQPSFGIFTPSVLPAARFFRPGEPREARREKHGERNTERETRREKKQREKQRETERETERD